MICQICKNLFLLSQHAVAVTGTPEDLQTVQDLADTLQAHANECIGMAANMIGVNKRIIAAGLGGAPIVMLNPVITAKTGEFAAEEGCLSLTGTRPVKRYKRIAVSWQDTAMQPHTRSFTGLLAQVIQHECDHLEGIII